MIVWKVLFGAMMLYVAWWLIYAIRQGVAFEIEMGLGVGSLWAAWFSPVFFEDLPPLFPSTRIISIVGYGLLVVSLGLFAIAVRSLKRGGEPGANWEQTTRLTMGGIHGVVRHPMQLSGILGAIAVLLLSPTVISLALAGFSITCFALGTRSEDRYNLDKFGASYRAYMADVPALNLIAGLYGSLKAEKRKESRYN